MKLPFTKPKQRRQPSPFQRRLRPRANRSDNLLKKRKLAKIKDILSKILEQKRLIYSVSGFILLVVFFLVSGYLLTSDYFSVKRLEFIGNTSVSDKVLQDNLNQIVGTNIFLLRGNIVKTQLTNNQIYFQNIQIKKFLPDKLIITLQERQPSMTIINFTGSYLIDDQGNVIEVIDQGIINFSSSDIDIIKGFGDPNGDYVQARMKTDLDITPDPENPADANETFDFSTYSLSEKLATLEQIRSELMGKASEIHSRFAQAASRSDYAALPRIYEYSNELYNVNDQVNLSKLELTREARTYFSANQSLIIERITWEGPYLAKFNFTNGKTILFGTNRNISEQIEDYIVINEQLRLNGKDFSIIDLSSKKVSVK